MVFAVDISKHIRFLFGKIISFYTLTSEYILHIHCMTVLCIYIINFFIAFPIISQQPLHTVSLWFSPSKHSSSNETCCCFFKIRNSNETCCWCLVKEFILNNFGVTDGRGACCSCRDDVELCSDTGGYHGGPDFNTMCELYDPSTVMFFFRTSSWWLIWVPGTTRRLIGQG